MFDIKNKQINTNGLYDIVENFCSLINDGNNELLYSGTNKFGSKILGSILFEDDENLFLRYIHTLITDEIFYKFINKEISLKNIIINCNSIFIVDKSYNNEIINTALVPIEEIPTDFLPLENSFCPDFVKKSSFDNTFSLKRKLADLHKAEPLIMSDTNDAIKDIENKGFDRIEVKNKLSNGDKLPLGLIGTDYNDSVSSEKNTNNSLKSNNYRRFMKKYSVQKQEVFC